MPGTMSRARQAAEAALDKTQSQFLSRTRALDEQNTEAADRITISYLAQLPAGLPPHEAMALMEEAVNSEKDRLVSGSGT